MSLRELLKRMVIHYFIIFTATIYATFFYCKIFYPDIQIDLHLLSCFMLFALLGDLPVLLFYSRHEFSNREYHIRSVIHFVLLECVLMWTGYQFDLYHTVLEGVIFFITILLVYMLVRFLNYMIDQRTAKSINDRIHEMNLKS